MILNGEPDMTVIATAATGTEAVAQFRQHSPDITLMDLRLPEMGGVEAIRAIRHLDPDARIIVLTMYTGDEDIHRAIAAGASTYLLKDALADDLPRIVRDVHTGRRTLPPDVEAKLQERAAQPTLTSREIEVIELVAAGRRDKEIALALSISNQTGARAHEEHLRQAGRERPDRGDGCGNPPRNHSRRLNPTLSRRRQAPLSPERAASIVSFS